MKSPILKLGILSLCLFAFSQVNAQSNERNAEQMFTKVDKNADNALDIEEFTFMIARKSDGKVDPAVAQERFNKVDLDSNGSISREEFTTAQDKKKARKEERTATKEQEETKETKE